MVEMTLTGGADGDLSNDPSGGVDNDVITVGFEDPGFDYYIYTWAGDDLINVQTANANAAYQYSVHAGAGNDTVQGGAGVDRIGDQSGDDLYLLRDGNDTYNLGIGDDTVDGGAGVDEINFRVSITDAGLGKLNDIGITFDLARTGVQDFGIFGNDRISGFEVVIGSRGHDRIFGTAGANTMFGDEGGDLLNGRGGADSLEGSYGFDTLIGGGGADTMNGETHKDMLTGGSGADVLTPGLANFVRDFVIYTRMSDSGTGTSLSEIDRILSFDKGGSAKDDKIDLSDIDARPGVAGNQAFIFRGTGGFTSSAGEIRLVVAGGNTLVRVDIDGDRASEMNIRVDGVVGLSAGDFLL
jgi:serralysin